MAQTALTLFLRVQPLRTAPNAAVVESALPVGASVLSRWAMLAWRAKSACLATYWWTVYASPPSLPSAALMESRTETKKVLTVVGAARTVAQPTATMACPQTR